MTDATILSTLGVLNAGEMTAARAARRRAARTDVKAVADLLLSDHAQMQGVLDSVGKIGNIVPHPGARAEALENQMRAERDRLEQLVGRQFDRAYAEAMVRSHEDALAEANRLANLTRDAGLRGAILRAIPLLQVHLDTARALQHRVEDAS
jgi:putative membrane protein